MEPQTLQKIKTNSYQMFFPISIMYCVYIFYILNNFHRKINYLCQIYVKSELFKGTDFFFFCEKYTPFHPLSFGMTTITVGQREVRLAGVQKLRALSERRLSVVLTGVSFILFYLFYFIFFTFYYSTISYILNNKLP